MAEKGSAQIVVAFGFFLLTMLLAALFGAAAMVVWLSDVVGSFIVAALIFGSAFALLSLIIYLASIRDAVARITQQIDTIYNVAALFKSGFEWVVEKVLFSLNLRDIFTKRGSE